MAKLGVFGDSFAQSTPDESINIVSWPYLVAKNLNLDVQNFARAGTSVWYSCDNFLKNYKDFTHIIFVYTDQNRWPSLPKNLLEFSSVYDESQLSNYPTINETGYATIKKLIEVHKYIFNEEFNQFVFQSVFDKVNELCRENNIALVNILPFFNEEDVKKFNFDKMYGTCITTVNKISQHEIYIEGKTVPKHKDLLFYVKNRDYRRNHINNENNKRMAEIVKAEMHTTSPKIINAFAEPGFNYDTQLLLDYREHIMQNLKENWK